MKNKTARSLPEIIVNGARLNPGQALFLLMSLQIGAEALVDHLPAELGFDLEGLAKEVSDLSRLVDSLKESPPDITHTQLINEAYIFSEATRAYGGPFMVFLGRASRQADVKNLLRLRAAFLPEWYNYIKLHAAMEEKKDG